MRGRHERRNRYSIRKFSVGVASVLVATFFCAGGGGQVVQAADGPRPQGVSSDLDIYRKDLHDQLQNLYLPEQQRTKFEKEIKDGDRAMLDQLSNIFAQLRDQQAEEAIHKANLTLRKYMADRLDEVDVSHPNFKMLVQKLAGIVDNYRNLFDIAPNRKEVENLEKKAREEIDTHVAEYKKGLTAGKGDAGKGDAGQGDAGQGDAGQGDAGQGDAGQGDAGQGDAGQGDAGKGDAGKGDAGKGDAGQGDAGQGDAGKGDAGQGDAGKGDAGQGDAGQGDAGQGDAGKGDAGQGDAGQGDAGKGDAGQGDAGQGDAGKGQAGDAGKGQAGDAGKGQAGDAGQDQAGDAGKGDAGQGDAGQGDAGQGDAGQGDAGQGDAGQGDAGQGDAGQGDAKPDADAGQGNAKPDADAGQGNAKPDADAGQGNAGKPSSKNQTFTGTVGGVSVTVLFDKPVNAEKVTVKEITQPDLVDRISRQVGGGSIRLFDLSLTRNGKETHVNEERTVRLALDGLGGDVQVYHVKSNGQLELLNSKVEDGHVIFRINHFSLFAIKTTSSKSGQETPSNQATPKETTKDTTSKKTLPNTGTADSTALLAAAASTAILGLGLAGRRRKED
ncbi:YSIRK-type signal peptide-containing protein [Streptococcus sp. Marseille-Q5986]|uniref:YSIRK-type signal peptide-containing protein n=1 Tax=Streptococcus sp. Marseille-Q5986 TaxID=2972782 RepID=UPI0022641944|nr:YSIRK-type signal peptide-containing protein [Streptococcus sp. Marseille-Q5986]